MDGEDSTLHFNRPIEVRFHISINFEAIFCGIGTLLTTTQSDTEVSNCFSLIASKSSIAVLTDTGTMTFLFLSLVR